MLYTQLKRQYLYCQKSAMTISVSPAQICPYSIGISTSRSAYISGWLEVNTHQTEYNVVLVLTIFTKT